MNIKLNGEIETVNNGSSILSLLLEKGTDPKTVIVEVDGNIHKHDDFENIKLSEGSVVEVLRFVGGG